MLSTQELRNIVMGNQPETVTLIHRVLDGDRIDLNDLSKSELNYLKTFGCAIWAFPVFPFLARDLKIMDYSLRPRHVQM